MQSAYEEPCPPSSQMPSSGKWQVFWHIPGWLGGTGGGGGGAEGNGGGGGIKGGGEIKGFRDRTYEIQALPKTLPHHSRHVWVPKGGWMSIVSR
mmetsp:Transcript_85345/g.255705  ORF Transcript_85345/g.255705 Transcript_85345/m.255705 type:complete len:94 (+) Transcript_85345:19-300(+)